MSAFIWHDISSRSRGEKFTEPKTVELRLSVVWLVVTRHIHHPGKWLANAIPFLHNAQLDSVKLEDAKAEAIRMLKERVAVLSADLSLL